MVNVIHVKETLLEKVTRDRKVKAHYCYDIRSGSNAMMLALQQLLGSILSYPVFNVVRCDSVVV